MGKISELEQRIEQLNNEKERLEETLKQVIGVSMKEAIEESVKEQRINRISKHIFTVKFSQLIGNPWSPSFYDWEASANILFDYLIKIQPRKWRNELQSLYDKRSGNRVDLPFKRQFSGSKWTEKTPISAEFIKKIIEKL